MSRFNLLFGFFWVFCFCQFSHGYDLKAHKALSDFKAGKYDEALKGFLDAQIDNPQDENIKYNLANTYYKLGQFKEAEALFQATSGSNDPDLAYKSFFNLGHTAFKQGKLLDAINHYQNALKLRPQDPKATQAIEFVRNEMKRLLEEQKKRQEQQAAGNQGKDQQSTDNQGANQQGASQNNTPPSDQQPNNERDQKDQSAQNDKNDKKGATDQDQEGQQSDSLSKSSDEATKSKDESQKELTAAQKSDQGDEKSQDQNRAAMAAEENTAPNGKKALMDPAEVKKWLSRMKDQRGNYYRKKASSQKRYQVEKDW